MRTKKMNSWKAAVVVALLASGSAKAGFEQFNPVAGGMDVFDLSGAPYQFSIVPFGLPALQAITTDNRTFELIPNVNLYADNPGSADWRDNGGAGPDGAKFVVANTLFEMAPGSDIELTDDIDLVEFSFTVDAFDLDTSRYTLRGFAKVLKSSDGTYSEQAIDSVEITGTGSYTVFISALGLGGELLQVGWSMSGQNANPADDWGSATVTATDLFATSLDNTAPMPDPMVFSVAPHAVSSTAISMTASNAVDDNYAVEYLFTNTVNNTSSEWQSSPTWVDSGPSLPPVTNAVDLINDPTFLGLNANWAGFAGGPQTPSSFVSVSSGVATVTPGSTAEWDFYQEFVDVFNAGQTYEFSIVSANSTLVGATAVAFVKAFGPGYTWKAGEFQTVPLALNGSATSLSITAQEGTTIYQVGVFTTGATSGSYDVSNPMLTTMNITPASSGLTPDTEYMYRVKARDLSPQNNETAWSAPVAGTSTVFDVTAPMPDPMQFAVAPYALGDTAISMTASTATDDMSGVEYLFTNTVNNTSSGWQSSPTWVNVGELSLSNANFEADGNGWDFANGDTSGTATTNISGNTSALAYANGGWAVVVQAVSNIAAKGFAGGNDVTFSVDVRALAGLNGGGAILKMESWGAGSLLHTSGDVSISPTESWDSYSMPYTIAAGADEVRIVVGTVLYPAGPTAGHYLFDNAAVSKGGSLTPGTEYTYRVKARDTSPNYNETAWSSPASATTTGSAPVTPFDVQFAGFVDGVGAVFAWDGVSGATYDVQYSTNLVTGPWMDDPSLGALNILSTGGAMSATSTVDGVSVFFRVIAD